MAKIRFLYPVALTIAFGTSFSSSAQDIDRYGRIQGIPERVIVLTGDSARIGGEMVGVLYDSRNLHFQDPRAPRFLMIDREGNTALGIGGYVQGIIEYDFDGAIESPRFATFMIPVPRDPAYSNRFGSDATRSTIFLQLVRNTPLGVLSGYVQTDFAGNGDNYGVRVRQAYVRLAGFTFGLANTTFADLSASVPTIDYQGPSGSVGGKNMIFQYQHDFTEHFGAAIAVENTEYSYTTSAECEKIANRCPDIPGYIQYQWRGGQDHVRLSGVFRGLSYRNLVSEKNEFVTGWGVQLSTVFKPASPVTVYGSAVYGKGISYFINDLYNNGYDLIHSGDGHMTAPRDFGMVGGVKVDFSKRFFTSASYSINRVYDAGDLGPDAYRRAAYFCLNGFYTFDDGFQIGAEYLHGVRRNYDRDHNGANRVEFMVKYSF